MDKKNDTFVVFSGVKTSKGNPFISMDSKFQGLSLPYYNKWQEKISDLLAEGWVESDIALLLAAHYAEAGERFSAKYTLEELASSKLVNYTDEDCYGHSKDQEAVGLLEVVVFFTTSCFRWVKTINPPQVCAIDENGNTFYGLSLNEDAI